MEIGNRETAPLEDILVRIDLRAAEETGQPALNKFAIGQFLKGTLKIFISLPFNTDWYHISKRYVTYSIFYGWKSIQFQL